MRAFVLSSGGLDSTTCIAKAIEVFGEENVESISINYGQRHRKELFCADNIAKYYGIKHHVIDLSNIFRGCDNPLMGSSSQKIEMTSYKEQVKNDPRGKVRTYVPFRNGLFLSAMASYAMSLYPDDRIDIWIGVHADDSAGNAYADTSFDFISMMNEAIDTGTYGQVSVCAPFVRSRKADVVREGLRLKVPYGLTWSCYNGEEKACGLCATCRDRLEAFRLNDAQDPIEYQEGRDVLHT